ncbi:MAG: calcium/sodium antiporter [Acidobacteria bacterium]|nr:calcium/sodium antiporter [Acidobacteriota bacterium]
MLYDILLIAVGFALVAKGGDLFVDSSIFIGRALRIPRFVIGGTLVSLATTAPELVVSVTAASMGDSGIALGNAVGSCICNIGLIVGLVAIIMPVEVDRPDFIRRAAWMAGGGVLVVAFSWDGSMERMYGLLLLAGAVAYLAWDLAGILRSRRQSASEAEDPDAAEGLGAAVGWFAVGAVCVIVGSRLLVTSGQGLAAALGVPSAIIGFSVIAIGTSVPELVTGVTAARKGVPDLSLGNILGANVLNLLLVVGLSGTIQPLQLDAFSQLYGFPWLGIFFVAVIGAVLRFGVVRRAAGIALLLLYALYVIGLVSLPVLT